VIKSFRHNALKRFFETGQAKGIPADMGKRLKIRLDFLNRATILEDLNFPGWALHALKGSRKGEHAITVTGNFRLTFRFENGDVRDVNLEDYH
jgi:toxin HigB-1